MSRIEIETIEAPSDITTTIVKSDGKYGPVQIYVDTHIIWDDSAHVRLFLNADEGRLFANQLERIAHEIRTNITLAED